MEIIFLITVFIIPWNLGKHFILTSSYIGGYLIDYLIPVIYIQDVLIFIGTVLYIFKKGSFNNTAVRFYFLFVLCVFLSVFFSKNPEPSFYFFTRLFLYIGFFSQGVSLLADPALRQKTVKVLLAGTFLLSLLGLAQFVKQEAVFNNYLFFGEQPYLRNSLSMVRENFLGHSVIPAYGLFRHPNTYGGYLSVVLTLLLFMRMRTKNRLAVGGVIALGLLASFSLFAYLSFLIGLVLVFLSRRLRGSLYNIMLLTLLLLIPYLSLKTDVFSGLSFFDDRSRASFWRRGALLQSSARDIAQNLWFGVGANSFTVDKNTWVVGSSYKPFIQPVHNVFALVWAESGAFALLFLVLLILYVFGRGLRRKNLGPVLLVQCVLLFSIDHYFYTQHQTFLLFLLTLALALSYTEASETA